MLLSTFNQVAGVPFGVDVARYFGCDYRLLRFHSCNPFLSSVSPLLFFFFFTSLQLSFTLAGRDNASFIIDWPRALDPYLFLSRCLFSLFVSSPDIPAGNSGDTLVHLESALFGPFISIVCIERESIGEPAIAIKLCRSVSYRARYWNYII